MPQSWRHDMAVYLSATRWHNGTTQREIMKPIKITAMVAAAMLSSVAPAQTINTSVYFAYHQGQSITYALSRRPCSDAAAAKHKWLKAATFQRNFYGIQEESDACWKEEKNVSPYGTIADLAVCMTIEKRVTTMCEPANYDAFRATSSLPKRADF